MRRFLRVLVLVLTFDGICNANEVTEGTDLSANLLSQEVDDVTGFETIEVMINETATLPCNIKLRKEDKTTLVIWYKNGSSVPIYSVDMRERHIPEHANHWSYEKIMGGRAHFNFDQRSLSIEHVTMSDEGFYKCRIDFKQTQTQNYHIKLIVVVAVQNITVMEAVRGVEGAVLPAVTEGSSLSATCVAVGGNPKPKVTWWRGSDQLDYTFEEDEDIVKNILWMENVQRKNMDERISCKAENSNLTKPVFFNVSINLHVGAEEIRFLGENKEMSAGRQYKITCEAKGSRPPANITWWKDSNMLEIPSRYSVAADRRSSTSVIMFTPEGADSGKTLSCEATNIFVPHEKRKDFWTLKVNYAPIISLNFGKNINSSAIQENEDVYFECSIKADPWITKIRWLHNNKQIASNPSAGIIISNQTLVLQQVTRNSSGYYRCAAQNAEAESVSQSVKLDVKYEPVCRMNQQRVYGAERNEEINITCQVDGNPTPTWFRWSFNNSMVHIVSVNNFINKNGSSVITYRPTTETNYGTLLCSSQNELGPQVVPCVFHVVSAGKPDSPHNCSVANKTESWLYVKCLRGFDGGLPQEFICEVIQEHEQGDKVISNITSKTEPEFRVTGLKHGTSYRVVIYATNVKGKSKEYVLLNVTTAPEAKTQRRRSIDNSNSFLKTNLAAVIIVISAVVLLIAIVVIVLITKTMLRKRRRKRRDSEELRKAQLSQGSLSHSEDDKNPDLIPQSTLTGISCPILNSISVQTSSSDSDISILPVREKSIISSKIPTLLEANRLEELVWPPNKWSTTIEPIMLVLPESMSIVPKQNAETQTPSSPQNRKESAV